MDLSQGTDVCMLAWLLVAYLVINDYHNSSAHKGSI